MDFDKLDELFEKYSSIRYRSIKIKLVDVNPKMAGGEGGGVNLTPLWFSEEFIF